MIGSERVPLCWLIGKGLSGRWHTETWITERSYSGKRKSRESILGRETAIFIFVRQKQAWHAEGQKASLFGKPITYAVEVTTSALLLKGHLVSQYLRWRKLTIFRCILFLQFFYVGLTDQWDDIKRTEKLA